MIASLKSQGLAKAGAKMFSVLGYMHLAFFVVSCSLSMKMNVGPDKQ